MVIRILNKLQHTIEELREHFSKGVENIRKNQSEMKTTIAEMENR